MHSRNRRHILWLLVFAASQWVPAVLWAQCVSGYQNGTIRSNIGTIDSAGVKHIKYYIDSSIDPALASMITAAVNKWNESSSQTGVKFDVGTSGDYIYRFWIASVAEGEKCSTTSAGFGAMLTNFTSMMNSNAAAANAETNPNKMEDVAALTSLVMHEVGHVLLLPEAGYRASGTIMTNTNPNLPDCTSMAKDAQYPAGPSEADRNTARGCSRGTIEEPTGGTGDSESSSEQQFPDGEICNVYWAYPVYECWDQESTNTSSGVTCTIIGYQPFGPPVSNCDGGPPM